MPEAIYDFEEIKKFVGDDENALKQMLCIFVDNAPKTLSKLTEYYNCKDYKNLGFYAHKLKTSVDLLNITSLKSEIRKIEHNSQNRTNLHEIPELVEKVRRIIPLVVKSVKQYCDKMNTGN